MRFQNTPEIITELLPNEVIIVGTNTKGIHGAGLALEAKNKWGLIPGVSMGLCGQSYGIITKDLDLFPIKGNTMDYYRMILEMIEWQINTLYRFANFRKDLTFYVTKIGCGLGGFTIDEIKSIFSDLPYTKPNNVCLPIEFE